MDAHEFTLLLGGTHRDAAEAVYTVCDDALLWSSGGTLGLSFSRDRTTRYAAIRDALADVRSAGVEVLRILPTGDHDPTLPLSPESLAILSSARA